MRSCIILTPKVTTLLLQQFTPQKLLPITAFSSIESPPPPSYPSKLCKSLKGNWLKIPPNTPLFLHRLRGKNSTRALNTGSQRGLSYERFYTYLSKLPQFSPIFCFLKFQQYASVGSSKFNFSLYNSSTLSVVSIKDRVA